MLFSLPAVIPPTIHLSAAQVHDQPKPHFAVHSLSKYADTSYANRVSVFRASCGRDKCSEHILKGGETQHPAQRYASKARYTAFLSQVALPFPRTAHTHRERLRLSHITSRSLHLSSAEMEISREASLKDTHVISLTLNSRPVAVAKRKN